jgi:hypothetical protein
MNRTKLIPGEVIPHQDYGMVRYEKIWGESGYFHGVVRLEYGNTFSLCIYPHLLAGINNPFPLTPDA